MRNLKIRGDVFSNYGFAPLERAFEDLNSIFDAVNRDFGCSCLPGVDSADFVPRLDVYSGSDMFNVTIELAGIDKKDIDVKVIDDKLVISGKKEKPDAGEEPGKRYHERIYGSFHREVQLPERAEIDAVNVNLKNGILDVSFPVLPEKKKRILEVEIKSDKE